MTILEVAYICLLDYCLEIALDVEKNGNGDSNKFYTLWCVMVSCFGLWATLNFVCYSVWQVKFFIISHKVKALMDQIPDKNLEMKSNVMFYSLLVLSVVSGIIITTSYILLYPMNWGIRFL
jgi:hypothetical protein